MISIAEMKELVEKEVKAEKESAKIKYDKDLAMYRDRLKKVKPKLMEYIEKCIYNDIKYNNSVIKLYTQPFEEMFKPINKYGTNILFYLSNNNLKPNDAYDVAIKELAEEVRQELYSAGVKRIIENSNCIVGQPYIILEV